MHRVIDFTVRLIRAVRKVYSRKWSFLGLFAVVFFVSVSVLAHLDLLPETELTSAASGAVLESSPVSVDVTNIVTQRVVELPNMIEISAVGIMANVVNPTTSNIAALDKELLKGAVRHPASAKLGETGNIVIFGHSSYLPVVRNRAYKTFNEIQKLTAGDVVTIRSSDTAYTYKVRSVEEKSADDGVIDLSVTGRVLTLVTCSSFGAKEDRFVVTADFVESYPVSS